MNAYGDEEVAPAQSVSRFGDAEVSTNRFGDEEAAPTHPGTDSQRFQANAGLQSAADQYVKDKWGEYGRIAGQSQGQAIRDHAKAAYGVDANPSPIPALDYRPEHDPVMQASYVRSQLADQPGGLDRVQQLEDRWRHEYLGSALFQAQQAAMNAPSRPASPDDVGLIHGHVDAVLRNAAHAVTDNVQGGAELAYGIGNYNANDGLHGAAANPTPMQLARDASLGTIADAQRKIDDFYPESSNAARGGLAKITEGIVGAATQLALTGGGLKAGGMQKALAFGQMGGQIFGNSYADQYRAARDRGMSDSDASRNALIGGLADAGANTYLMKFGVVGDLANPVAVAKARQIAALALKDAIAQGLVGGGQQGVSDISKFIGTGEGSDIKGILDAAVQNAAVGGAFGAFHGATEYKPNRAGAAGVDHTEAAVSSGVAPDAAAVNLAKIARPEDVNRFGDAPEPQPGESNGPGPEQPVAGVGSGPDSGGGVRGPDRAGGVADAGTSVGSTAPALDVRTELPTPLLDKQAPKLRVNNPDGTSTAKPIDFGNPTDKALYAATEPRQGKVGKEATAFLESKGYDADRIDREGTMLRDRVAELHDPKQDRVTVPGEDKAPAAKPKPAPGAGDVLMSPDLDETKERQRIGVDESRVTETRYGSAYRDLSEDEIRKLAAVSGENAVRGMHNPETGETVWWGADKAGHHDMARALRWPEPADRNSLEAQIKGDKVWVHRGGEGKAEAFDAVTQRRNTPDYMQSPAADGYKTEMDRMGRKAQMERVKGEMDREQGRAAERIGSKPENQTALDNLGGRVPTPDRPTTDAEAKASAKRLVATYPGVKIHRPANREQAGLTRLVEQVTGRRVVYVSREGEPLPFKGVAFRGDPGVAFVRSDLNGEDMVKTAWHEFWHNFQTQHPDLAESILHLVPEGMRQEAADDYLRRAGGPESDLGRRLVDNADKMNDEAGATLFENFATNPRIMERLTGDQRSVLRRFFDYIRAKLGLDRPLTDVERKMRDYLDEVREALKTGEKTDTSQDGVFPEDEPGRTAAAPQLSPLGLDQFGKDTKDAAKDAADAVASAWDGVKRWVAPASRGKDAERAAGIMRESLADYAQRMDRLNAAFDKSKKFMDKLPVSVTRDFWEKMEKGQKQADPALQPIADAMRGIYDDRRVAIQGLGTGKLTKFITDYVNHLYKEKSAGKTLANLGSRRPWEGNKGFLKQRKHALFSDAFAAGLTPLTENPVEMMQMYVRQADKYITAQRAFQEMRGVGLAVRVAARDVGKWQQKGYAKIDDKIATIYAPPNRKGGLSIAGYQMAPEPVATLINNHLGPGLSSDPYIGQAFRMYRGVGNVLNQVQLGLSGFHAAFTTVDAAVANVALGIEHAVRGNWKEGAVAAAKSLSLVGPAIENIREGMKMHTEWLTPGSNPDYAAFVDAFKAGGGRDGQDPFYHTDFREKMMQAWRQGNVVGAAVRGPLALLELAASPILEKMVPRMKEGAWMQLARLEFGPDGRGLVGLGRDEIRQKSRKIWDSVENRLGEMTYDNLFWNRTAKDLAMASTRAVGWNLGTIRELGGGTVDTAKALARLATGKRPELTHRMAYTIALPMLTALLGGVTHRLMTGQNPQELKDYFFPGTGELDKSGHMVRLQVPGYMGDMWKYAKDAHDAYDQGKPTLAMRTLSHKTHPMLNTIIEMLNNQDYYGDKIRNEDDPFIKRRLDEIKFMGKQLVPFGIRDVGKLHDERQGMKSLLPLAGVVRARTDVTHSDAENVAARLMEESHPSGSRTSEQRDHNQAVRDLSDSLRAHEPDAVDKIRKAASNGTLNQGDIDHIRQDQRTPDLLGRMVKRLDGPAALKVWDAATPDERRRIGPILMGKVRSSKTMTRDQKVEAIRKLQSDWKGALTPEAEEGD